MATNQYIGARYVPIFADPTDWNNTRTYEPLTIVIHDGNSYTSRQYVPKGIDISNDDFWALTGNYNAQIEAYRKDVLRLEGEVNTLEGEVNTLEGEVNTEVTRAKDAESKLTTDLSSEVTRAKTTEDVLQTNIDILATYVTPEMYGAKGDGVTDDSAALQEAVNQKRGVIGYGTYYCEQPIVITSNDDNGCQLITVNTIISNSSDAAVIFNSSKNVAFRANTVLNENGTCIKYTQDEDKTCYNTNIYINKCIGYKGVVMDATTYGIYECSITAGLIKCTSDAIYLKATQNTQNNRAFIGEIHINVLHAYSTNDWAVKCEASLVDSGLQPRITGVVIAPISIETSKNGILCDGDCKLINIQNIRVFEKSSDIDIKTSGYIRYFKASCSSPANIDKLQLETTASWSLNPIVIEGGIYSPTQYRFADSLICSVLGVTYLYNTNYFMKMSKDFTFGDNGSWRCVKYFYNEDSVNYTITDIPYFNPIGIKDIYISQNYNNNSTVQLIMGGVTVFDGTQYSSTSRETFKISASIDSSNIIRYTVEKV